jgi:hypothetical protein
MYEKIQILGGVEIELNFVAVECWLSEEGFECEDELQGGPFQKLAREGPNHSWDWQGRLWSESDIARGTEKLHVLVFEE